MSLNGGFFSDEFDIHQCSDLNTVELEGEQVIAVGGLDEEPNAFSNLSSLDELDATAIQEASEKLNIINLVGKTYQVVGQKRISTLF